MATKFSDFTAQAATGTTFVVGYDGTTNTRYTQDQLTNFVLDGTLSAARTLKLDGNNLTINYGTGSVFPSLDMGKVILYPNGENSNNPPTTIKTSGNIYFTYGAPYYQGLVWTSFNTSQKAWYTSMYGGGGWSHYQGYSVIGPNFASITSGGALTAKLGIIGKHNDNTSYALRVQNSDLEDMFFVRNDKYTTVNLNNGIPNGFLIKNEATWTMLDAGDSGGNVGQLRLKDNNNERVYLNARLGVQVANSGNAAIMPSGSLFAVTSTDKGFLPPRNADPASNISSPTTGLVAYNSTSNKLQFYNGTAWTDAAGGDNIYTADGTLTGNRNVDLATYNLGFTNGQVGIGTSSPLYTLDTKGTVANNWLARVQNESGTGYGLQVKVDSNSSGKVTFATKNSVGYTMTVHNNGNVAIGKNNLTGPSARLQIKGSGTTNATTALLVEDASGNDIIKALDDRTFGLGYNALQITNSVSGNESVRINDRGGAPLLKVGVSSGSAAAINMCNGYFNTFSYTTVGGMVYTNAAGVNSAQDPCSMFTLNSSSVNPKGMLPPRLTTTLRDAINSGTFTTGTTIYNTTDNKLQFYNGTSWTDAGGGDNIYTADGDILATRTINDRAGGFTGTAGSNALKMNVRNSGALIVAGYQNNGDPGTTNNCIRWGPGTTAGTMNVRGNLALSSGGGAISLVNSGGTQYTTINQAGISFTTTGNQEYIAPAIGFGTSASTSYRVRIKGATSTSSGYGLQVQNSSNDEMLSVRDDGAIAIGKSASPQGASAVTIGQLAETTVSNSIAIGYNAEAAGGIAIGLNADNNQSYSQCIGGNTSNAAQYQTVIGYDADGLSGADRSIAIGASAKAAAQGGIAIGVGANAQNHCIILGRNVGVSGTPDNSVVFSTRGGNNITYSEADSFTWYNTSDTVPNLKFRTGDNVSYWNPAGETAAFGFSTTSPTATVDINGTFRLRSASNVSGKVLTADANGNATWQTASSGGGGYSPTISIENTNGGDVDLYDDNIVRLWLDDGSSDDIELEITNYASSTSSTYHVNYTNFEGGASSARTTTVDLNQSGATSISTLDFSFTDDECMKLRIWSPRLGLGVGGEGEGFPFYEITIVKSGSLYTGAPVITSVLKSTS